MEIVSILRVLWRHLLLVVPGGIVVVVAVLAATHRVSINPPHLIEHQTISGRATGKVLLSSPDAPAAGVQPVEDQSDSLGLRASLLVDEMAIDELRRDVARRAGIPASQLVVMGPAAESPQDPVPLAVSAARSAASSAAPYSITTISNAQVPIVTIQAAAPSTQAAARLITAFSATLNDRVTTHTGADLPMSVELLGPPVVKQFLSRERRAVTLAIAATTMILWLAAIVIIAPFGRGPRTPRRGQRGRPNSGARVTTTAST